LALRNVETNLSFSCQIPQNSIFYFLLFFYFLILQIECIELRGCRFGKSKVINVRFVSVLSGFVSFTTSKHHQALSNHVDPHYAFDPSFIITQWTVTIHPIMYLLITTHFTLTFFNYTQNFKLYYKTSNFVTSY